MRTRLTLFWLVATLPMAVRAQPLEETVSITPASGADLEKAQLRQEMEETLWHYLQESRVPGTPYARHRVVLDDADRAVLADPDCETCATPTPNSRIGVHKDLGLTISLKREGLGRFSDRSRRAAVGETAVAPGGDIVWTTSFQSQGATALRLHFTEVDLPKGTALYVYNDAGEAHGPYVGKGPNNNGDFWSHTIFGDHAWVQLHDSVGDPAVLDSVSFEIPNLSHIGPEFEITPKNQLFTKADCSANGECVINVNCYEDQPLKTARKAVAKIVFEVDGKTWGCSGSLLNDADDSDRTPWFLTANHCFETEASANSLEAFFEYQSPCGTCSGSSKESILGSTLWATGGYSSGDYTLVELSDMPSRWGLMGWTNANIRDSVGTEYNILSHPRGKPQRYSRHVVLDSISSLPAKIISDPIQGTTDQGSSGGPLFLDGGKVIGVVSVAAKTGTDAIDVCDPTTFNERPGALSYFWKSVRPYLAAPTGTYKMHVADVVVDRAYLGSVYYQLDATVKIVDELGNGVPQVLVAGLFSGDLNIPIYGFTNHNGEVALSYVTGSFTEPSFTFCVDNLIHSFFNTYDSASDVVSCTSY